MLNSPAEEIKNKLDIVDVVGSYIKLQKAGVNYRACCPFHSEKGPSFFVSPARQIWHCFGCGKGGDIFGFVKEIENVEFGDALRILAQKAGVELRRQDPEIVTERNRLYEICELACQFFEKQLEASKKGQEAKQYLLDRGIGEDSIKKWKLGYAPDVWQGLSDFVVGKGYKREEVEKAGLAIRKDRGNFYDRFRSRIIFPVFDLQGQVVGFGGRIFGKETRPDGQKEAKYINSPATLLYDKSRVLYGLERAKMAVRKENKCIVVEGYTDAILSHQAGVENVVAASGTALTQYQLQIIKRYSENILTAFDMDIAGDSATKRGIELAISQGFNVKVVEMPEGKDPADVISQNPEDWKRIISKEKSILDFYFDTAFAKFSDIGKGAMCIEEKKEISKTLLPVVKRIPNKIEQTHWVQELSRRLDAKEADIEEEMKKVKLDAVYLPAVEAASPAKKEGQKSRKNILEERLMSLMIKTPEFSESVSQDLAEYFSPNILQFFSAFKNHFVGGNFTDYELKLIDFQKSLKEPMSSLFNTLSFEAEVIEEDEQDFEKEFKSCLREIDLMKIREKLDKISQEIKKAESASDPGKVKDLMQEFNRLAQHLNKL